MSTITPLSHEDSRIAVSVIVPARNSASHLENCLKCLKKSVGGGYEILVIDDASTDQTPEIASRLGVRVLELPNQCGPAVARNRAVQHCRGEILVFIDSDVLVTENVLQQLMGELADDSVSAVFGSYDDHPGARNYVSVYKNLMHHFFHQRSGGHVETFWSGCGAIRKSVFDQIGGFSEAFAFPSIEDIELGMRLAENGHSILLSPQIQVQHAKRWTLPGLIHTDIFRRGIPWTRLLLSRNGLTDNLNTSGEQRASVMIAAVMALGIGVISVLNPAFALVPCCVFLLMWVSDILSSQDVLRQAVIKTSASILVVTTVLCVMWEPLSLSILLLSGMIWMINRSSLRFLCRVEGVSFAVMSLPLHLVYFLYCGVSFAAGVLCHWMNLPLLVERDGEKIPQKAD